MSVSPESDNWSTESVLWVSVSAESDKQGAIWVERLGVFRLYMADLHMCHELFRIYMADSLRKYAQNVPLSGVLP